MAQLLKELKNKAKAKDREVPLKDDRGYFYDHLPEDVRVATIHDFFNQNGKLLIDLPFLLHSYRDPKRYECNRAKSNFPYPNSDFNVFLNNRRIYVFI